MPNWCSNVLKVTGENTQMLKEFVESVLSVDEQGNEVFSMDKLIPCPKELLETNAFESYQGDENDEEAKKAFEAKVNEVVEKYGASDWYTWRLQNWGCKWDIGECYVFTNDENEFRVSFDSPWSPPLTFFKNIGPKFPELEFSVLFEEPGMDFAGIYRISRGEDEYLAEDGLAYTDEEGQNVEYDSDESKWKYVETGKFIEEEDFWPESHNPFADEF